MTGSTDACLWIASAICWGSAGLRATAATSGRPSSPLTRRWKPPCPARGQPRKPGPALSADGPPSWTGGGATAPRLAPAPRSGNRSGRICGNGGAGEWKIRPPETRLYQGFAGAVQGRGVSFHVLPLFSADTFHISHFERRLLWTKIKAIQS